MLLVIDLIFGMCVYNDKLQIKFTFRCGPMIFGRVLAKYLVVTTLFHYDTELQTWITLYMSRSLSGGDIIKWHSKQIMSGLKRGKNVHDIFYQKVSCFHHDIYMYEKLFI
jgi:hypothetical protein